MSLNSVQDIVAVLCESCFDETRDSSSTLRSVLSGDLWQDEENFSQDLFVAAIRINAVATVQSMLNDGHDRFNPSKLFGRPVTIAAAHGHFEIIKLLLWTPPSQGLHFEFRCHAFERAARAGHLDTVKSIYDLICTVDPWIFWKMEGRPLPRYHLVHELRTPSIDVWNFMVELRKKHLADKWDEWLHRDKLTHLFRYAIYCGWKEMACYLLTLGAWPDGRSDDQFYKRPIYEVCKNGHFDITKSLLGHGAKTEGTIKIAARRGHYEIVRVLLEHGAETKGGLAAAAEGGYTCIARMLLDHGVDVNEDSPRPISSAIDLENSSMLALFLQRGAEVSADLRDAISRYEGVLPLLGHHQC
jgi:hypothetical protein